MELEERLALLSQATLRINESLDFDTALQGVVDSARALTASRYGAITIPGEVFQRPTFLVSGLTPEERQGFWDMPEGLGFFEYLSGLVEPRRVSNIERHLKAARPNTAGSTYLVPTDTPDPTANVEPAATPTLESEPATLHEAILEGNTDSVQILVDAGADVNDAYEYKGSHLHPLGLTVA